MATTGLSDQRLLNDQRDGGLWRILDSVICPGRIFWLGSNVTGAADDTAHGLEPGSPFATLDYAYSACTTARCDTVFVLPGHAETFASAADIATFDLADVRVIGLGTGTNRPTFTLGHADTTLTVTGANNTISNLRFITSAANVVTGITASATADGLIIEDCYFSDASVTTELKIAISLAAACNHCKIRRNHFFAHTAADTGATTSAIVLVGESAHTEISGNYVYGHYITNCLNAAATVTGLWVVGNVMCNIDSGAGIAYTGAAATQGVLAWNFFGGGKNGTSPIAEVTATWCIENYGCDVPAANGLITPAVCAFS